MSYTKPLMLLIGILLPLSAAVAAEMTEVSFDALPEAVKSTALSFIDKSNISKVSQINANSLIRYEIEADKSENNKEVISWDIVIAANGKIMKVARQVPYYTLTYPQMQEIEKRYPDIKITETESVDIHYYNVVGNSNGQAINFRLYEDGLIEDQTNP